MVKQLFIGGLFWPPSVLVRQCEGKYSKGWESEASLYAQELQVTLISICFLDSIKVMVEFKWGD